MKDKHGHVRHGYFCCWPFAVNVISKSPYFYNFFHGSHLTFLVLSLQGQLSIGTLPFTTLSHPSPLS